MVDQDNANSFVGVDLHDRFFEGWGAEKPPHIITEPIRFSGYTQGVRIKLAIPVLVMKQDNRVLSRIEIGEDHCTFLRRVGDCGKPVGIIEEPSLSDNSMARAKLSRLS